MRVNSHRRESADSQYGDLDEALAGVNYSKQYNKFVVREHKLKKRKDKYEDWYD